MGGRGGGSPLQARSGAHPRTDPLGSSRPGIQSRKLKRVAEISRFTVATFGGLAEPRRGGRQSPAAPPHTPRGAECFLEDRPSPAFPEMVPRKPRPLGCPPSSGGSARSRGCGEDARCRPCSGWLWRWRRCSPKCHCAAVGGGSGVRPQRPRVHSGTATAPALSSKSRQQREGENGHGRARKSAALP